jgi:hypothetical protein
VSCCQANFHCKVVYQFGLGLLTVFKQSNGTSNVSYAAPQVHRIVNVALQREYSLGIVFV